MQESKNTYSLSELCAESTSCFADSILWFTTEEFWSQLTDEFVTGWIMVLYWVARNRSWFLFLRCLLEDTDDVWIMSMMMETLLLLLLFIFRWFNIENYFEKSNKKNFKPFLLHPFHHHPEAAPTILLVRPGVSTRSEHPWSSSSDLVLPPGLWVFRLGVLRGDTSSFLYQLHHFNP